MGQLAPLEQSGPVGAVATVPIAMIESKTQASGRRAGGWGVEIPCKDSGSSLASRCMALLAEQALIARRAAKIGRGCPFNFIRQNAAGLQR